MSVTSAPVTNHELALRAYRQAGEYGLTDDEALAASVLHQNSWRPARIALMRHGLVVTGDGTRPTRTGRPAQVYRAA